MRHGRQIGSGVERLQVHAFKGASDKFLLEGDTFQLGQYGSLPVFERGGQRRMRRVGYFIHGQETLTVETLLTRGPYPFAAACSPHFLSRNDREPTTDA